MAANKQVSAFTHYLNRYVHYTAVLCLLLVLPIHCVAADGVEELKQFEQELEKIDKELDASADNESAVAAIVAQLTGLNQRIDRKVSETESQIERLQDQVDSLGEFTDGEPKEVTDKRREISNEIENKENILSQYNLIHIRVDERLNDNIELQKLLLTERILHKEANFVELAQTVHWQDSDDYISLVKYIKKYHGFDIISSSGWLLIVFAVFVFLLMGMILQKRIKNWISSRSWDQSMVDRIAESFLHTTAHYLTAVLIFGSISAILFAEFSQQNLSPAIFLLSAEVFAFLVVLVIIRSLFSPVAPARLAFSLTRQQASMLTTRLTVVAALSFVGFFILYMMFKQQQATHLSLMVKDILVSGLIVSLIWLVLGSRQIHWLSKYKMIRFSVIALLAGIAVLELAGYRNLASSALRVSTGLVVGFAIASLLSKIFSELFDALDVGTKTWHKPIRSAFGLKAKEHIPGLTFFRTISSIVIWLGFLYFAIRILGLSRPVLQTFHNYIFNGFNIGTVNINPVKILFAFIAFAILFSLFGWFKTHLEKKWLLKTRIQRSARETIVTLAGYIGIAIAVLFALSIAGFSFTNLAIIAGALSVGIGFGLQNIVNNFVSGLILLFERPIKTGDWIIVGNTEGYVKKISIRSTQIQTFDRADVIVPNSELISNQVTNWMLHDAGGRIRLPIGVAYGTDTEKVRLLLTKAAESHDAVIKDDPKRKIWVIFSGFGDSSLNFELRCFIENIDSALSVKSDLNFAIDRIFRENGIQIPFPQRDIHIIDSANKNENSENPTAIVD